MQYTRYMCVHICVHIYIYIYIYVWYLGRYIYIYIYIYTHTRLKSLSINNTIMIVETGRSGCCTIPFSTYVNTMVAVVITAPTHKSPLFPFSIVEVDLLCQ